MESQNSGSNAGGPKKASRLLRQLPRKRGVAFGAGVRVVLSTHPSPQGSGDVTGPGPVDLGGLKGNIGNQNYDIPDDVDISAINSVVIYCKPFWVIFSVAQLHDAV